MLNNSILINSDNKYLSIEFLYLVEGYFTSNIKIKSGEFSGSSNFCMPKDSIVSIVEILSEMHKELDGRCEIKDYDSDAFIVLEMYKHGHIFISGRIGGSHEDHNMCFKYATDQTILVNLLRLFKSYI